MNFKVSRKFPDSYKEVSSLWLDNKQIQKEAAMNRLRCKLYDLSSSGKLVSYDKVWRYQKALVEQAGQQYKSSNSSTDAIILVQHPSVYTLGRGATPDNIKFRVDSSCPHKVFRVERGGEATWHGPGQLVAYPILNLNQHKRDLHW